MSLNNEELLIKVPMAVLRNGPQLLMDPVSFATVLLPPLLGTAGFERVVSSAVLLDDFWDGTAHIEFLNWLLSDDRTDYNKPRTNCQPKSFWRRVRVPTTRLLLHSSRLPTECICQFCQLSMHSGPGSNRRHRFWRPRPSH